MDTNKLLDKEKKFEDIYIDFVYSAFGNTAKTDEPGIRKQFKVFYKRFMEVLND